MPEYLYPGVYVEEVSARGKSIEGVSTSTAGFVGPARFGPIGLKPSDITNLQEFERIYGDGGQLVFADSGQMHNYLWHAVRAFFAEGGRRLYIARAFLPRGNDDDGVASCNVPADGGTAALGIRARFPGAAGNFLVRFTVRLGQPTVLAVSVLLNDGSMRVWDHVPPDPAHLLAITGTGSTALPLTIIPGENVTNGPDVLNALFTAKPSLRAALDDPHSTESDRSVDVLLSGGNDGARTTSDVFRGGLQAFEDVEEISIVGAPGATEWKYVGIRRYFAFLEHSFDRGTQWTVFEPNGEGLWAKVQRNIEAFLLNEWQTGALMGDKPERAFFVRCDRSTMTQSDLDNGQLVCLIGVAPVRPAEFVILRIGQWTADRRC